MPSRYRFEAIFLVDSAGGTITPKYNVVINGMRFNQGSTIARLTSFGGLNLFNYVGRPLAGTWDPVNRVLTILGFY